MMPATMQKYSSDHSTSRRWIPVVLIVILVIAAGFAAFAFYITHRSPDTARSAAGFTGPNPPPPPQYNCPLDGTIVPNRAAASQRPIVVQVDNAPAARDQAGLSKADIVYEAMAEGQVTRFSAIFACHEAEVIGPVRSARLIDLELVPEYGALLADSGSSEGVTAALEATPDIPNINDNNFHDAAYWRTDDRVAPHNLMISTAGIRNGAAAAGNAVTARLPSLIFKDDTPAPAVSSISVPYSPWADVNYKYDAASNGWLRFHGNEVNKDAETGKQLAPKNVIIQYVPSSESDIIEDAGGDHGMQYALTGSGRALVFRDGQVIDGIWSRPNRGDITQYYDAAKKPIALNRGLTFIQIVDTSFQANWS
jgi:hypothetical protein